MLQSSLQSAAVLSVPLGVDFRKNACTQWYRSTHEARHSGIKSSIRHTGTLKSLEGVQMPTASCKAKMLWDGSPSAGPGSCRPHMGRCATLNPRVQTLGVLLEHGERGAQVVVGLVGQVRDQLIHLQPRLRRVLVAHLAAKLGFQTPQNPMRRLSAL